MEATHDRQRFLFPVIRYETINPDSDFYMLEGKEFRRKDRACDKAFRRFEQLRGEVLSQAIAVENELDRVISWYFVPRLTRDEDGLCREEDLRRDALVDLVLGQESFMISSKIRTLAAIIDLVEIPQPSSRELQRTLESVVEIRNQFAHRKVGVEWQTQEIALWDTKKRKWGFPDFDKQGKKSTKWHDRIPSNLGDLYSKYCKLANTVILDIWKEMIKLRDTNSTLEGKGS